jgi:hypothetical protein
MATSALGKRRHDVKAGTDLALMVCLVALPCHLASGDPARTWIGVALLVLLAIHNLLNLRWWRSLRSGGWRAPRAAQVVVTVLCLVLAVVSWVSWMNPSAVCWTFLAMSFHVGQCVWPMMRAELSGHGHVRRDVSPSERRAKRRRIAAFSAAFVIAGAASTILLGMLPMLALGQASATIGSGVPLPLTIAGLVFVLLAFASLGAWSQEALSHRG